MLVLTTLCRCEGWEIRELPEREEGWQVGTAAARGVTERDEGRWLEKRKRGRKDKRWPP